MMKKFLNKEAKPNNGIFLTKITNDTANKISDFYNNNPFPNYKKDENITDLIFNTRENTFIQELVKICDKKKTVIEFGSGTCQLSMTLASLTNSNFFAFDVTLNSLKIGRDFAKKNFINNIFFFQGDIFDNLFNEEVFDIVISNGVLHHTKDPRLAFSTIAKTLKKNGYIVIGLYNYIGRIKNYFYKFLFKTFGLKVIKFIDPILKKKEDDQIIAWLEDQFNHPVESTHSYDEIFDWFDNNNIDFVCSYPSCNFLSDKTFEIKKENKSNFLSRLLVQINIIFSSFGSDGALFLMIGKKK